MTSPAAPERPPGMRGQIKIWFRFLPRAGWLPYDTEGLWATRLGEDTARVDNVPFLQDGLAEGEAVRFTTDGDAVHWAGGRVRASGNCTVRVLPVPDGPLGRSARAVHERLAPFGLGGEVFSAEFPLVALTVPADADLARIKALLVRGRDEGWWHFEVPCATDAWRAA
ncbi:DUF4265 domain-containing protein [Streptomyces sp. NBC_01433]|uniref:DUF4265 domain-containing protein n=1 Tax=Streptomyces sp. NBC_01433 TaxID=2903864 RepID=UPI00224FDCAD|nr:DUF4265 domain-containing protein [Streptomyces sp. NBC_01433]MCX4674502.1 DUF4265 domain-containing protein [Streptomyces sp. NBC_01433]